MYDRQTESLWSQILRKAVTGPLTGTPLKTFPLVETSWKDWKNRHPETLVLSIKTGYTRPYHQDVYGQDRFDLLSRGIRGEKALGVIIGEEAKTYPFKQLKKVKKFPMKDRVGKQTVMIYFEKKSKKAWASMWNPSSLTSGPGKTSTSPTYLRVCKEITDALWRRAPAGWGPQARWRCCSLPKYRSAYVRRSRLASAPGDPSKVYRLFPYRP